MQIDRYTDIDCAEKISDDVVIDGLLHLLYNHNNYKIMDGYVKSEK